MFADNKFRFSLQWGNDTAEKLQAGELLERMGNKKSEFVVMAVTEYLRSHPDLTCSSGKIHIEVHSSQTPAQLRAMVEELAKSALESLIAGKQLIPADTLEPEKGPTGPTQAELADMLANLDAFFQ